MGGDSEINIPFGMTRKTKLAVQPLHGSSNPIPAEFIGVAFSSGDRTPTLQCATTQDLQGRGEILLATDTTAVRSKQNQLGGI